MPMIALVTGSSGFLGRHFVAALKRDGHLVYGWDLLGDPAHNALHCLRDPESTFSFDLVVHCAAVSPHRSAIDGRPLAVGAGGLELDAAMFQWAARTKPGRVVYLSSSAAYPRCWQEKDVKIRLAEPDIDFKDPAEPDGIYGWTKLTGERLAAAYREQGGAVTVVRPFSGYGEDQSCDFPFGAFRDRARARQDPFVVWGDGTQVRDWVHVDDIVGATLAAVDNGIDGPVNICTGVGTSMAELAALFAVEAGYDPALTFLTDKPAGVAYRVGDPALLNTFYTPRISIEEGVRRALEVADVAR